MNKRILSVAVALALCLSMSGCSRTPPSEAEPEIVLPEPSPRAQNMILGEQIASKPAGVELHYVADDGTSFTTITRSLVVSPGENIYQEAVDALLHNAVSPDRMSFIPTETQVIDAEYAGDVVTVNLSLDAHSIQSDQETLMLLASVVNTLLSMDGVRGVNVLVANQSQSIADLPVGTMTKPLSGVTPTYAQYNAERDYFLEARTGTISRFATLYFPSIDGDWFVPEIRELTFDSSDYASTLIRALRSGPFETGSAVAAIPEGIDLLLESPWTEVNSVGENVLYLNFSPTLRNYLALSAIDEWDLIGSVSLTLCSFVPGIDAVCLRIDGEPITECGIGEREISFENGLIHRSDCTPFIGSAATLYLPNADGTLTTAERVVSMARAQSPLSLLYALLDNAFALDDDLECFPEDIYYDDILGISVKDGIATINLSGNFYRQSQSLDENRERSVIYSMVNTLCELDDISGVRFMIEGISAETLSGSIYLKSILLPNPGALYAEATLSPKATQIP